uniref:Uncharacterized protein n=1 Tax=Panagrolaimus sp. ES5 TaxID=591445 RepID=A0AC34FG85_9BILA
MSSTRDLIVHVLGYEFVSSYNLKTRQYQPRLSQDPPELQNIKNYSQLFTQLQSIFDLKQVKVIVFSIKCTEFPNAAESYRYRVECRDFCQKFGIMYYIPFEHHFFTSSMISLTKTMVEEDEKIAIFLMDYGGLVLIRKRNSFQVTTLTQEWQKSLIEDGLQKIIFVQYPDSPAVSKDLEKAKPYFKYFNQTVINYMEVVDHSLEVAVNKVLHLMGKKIDPYYIKDQCFGKYLVAMGGKNLIKAEWLKALPFKKSAIVMVNQKERISLYHGAAPLAPYELVEEIDVSSFKFKKVKVTFKLDINLIYDFKIEPLISSDDMEKKMNEEAVNLTFDGSVPEKAQMIFEKQNFSVKFLEDGFENILVDSDGLEKTPIYIAFNEEKAVVGKAAMETFAENPKFVVFDLIKLCSISNASNLNPKWGFSLSKEDESIIVTMQTAEGEKKSTTAFLLALILKNGKDRIKKETGKKVKEIEIKFDRLFHNSFGKEFC